MVVNEAWQFMKHVNSSWLTIFFTTAVIFRQLLYLYSAVRFVDNFPEGKTFFSKHTNRTMGSTYSKTFCKLLVLWYYNIIFTPSSYLYSCLMEFYCQYREAWNYPYNITVGVYMHNISSQVFGLSV